MNFKRFFSFIIVVFLVVGVFIYTNYVVKPNVRKVCENRIFALNTKCVNDSILKCLNYSVYYDDLVSVEKNNENEIVMMTANIININKISREIVGELIKELETCLKNGINLPLFAFTGLELLSGYGKEINLKILTVASVNCDFSSTFVESGINQTLHSVYLNIESRVNVDFPLNNYVEVFETKILIAETIIVGKIPELYLNGKLFS